MNNIAADLDGRRVNFDHTGLYEWQLAHIFYSVILLFGRIDMEDAGFTEKKDLLCLF